MISICMTTYELVLMYKPDLSATDLAKLVDEITAKTKDLGGKLTLSEDWGLKNLAYKIDKFEKAYYQIYSLEIEAIKVNSVITYLGHKEGVIRNLLNISEKSN